MRSGLDVADTCHSSHKNYTDVGASHNGKRKPTLGSVRKITEDGLTKNGTKQKENATPDLQLRELTSQVSSELRSLESGTEPVSEFSRNSQDATSGNKLETNDFSPETLQSYKNLVEDQRKSLTAKLVLPSLSQPPPAAINLSDFRAKHKLMEEQNRARKVYLAKALEDRHQGNPNILPIRKKQTHEEQLRLSMIQEELQKLDQRLSCDVSIIRNQIEAASLEFMEAQKRYDRAEKEFLDAKLLLYTKLERKELLTHHLCTIIEQNEMRKAQKLSELMEKLQMPDSDVPEVHRGNEMTGCDPPGSESKSNLSSEIILTPSSVVLSQTQLDIPNGEKNNSEA
ncbi:uncharacterized protein LOC113208272 isoform X3 [Frankliniella occidentalis]|nr:uncharacterized protein LOC113208272 isoform X3 [Frankliniella occidentalis]